MDGKRVLVLFEPGRGGAAVLELARELVERQGATLTVVSVAPQGVSGARCGNSALDYNLVVQDSVAEDLDDARAWLGEFGARASFELLIERASPSLEEFAAAGGFDLVLLPARRRPLRAPGHPAAERLRVATGAELQVISRRPQQRAHA
jgi:nucleotide-binding universal stress UspA family protein